MANIPQYFNGNKFADKYGLNPHTDFRANGTELICPYLPSLTDSGLLDCVDDAFDKIRETRNILLQETDWTQSQDAVLSTQEKLDWSAYRQQLRDVTEDYATPEEVIWPTKPE